MSAVLIAVLAVPVVAGLLAALTRWESFLTGELTEPTAVESVRLRAEP
jgi:hypothetical protein